MKRVVLTSGPRGAGKSTYSKNFLKYRIQTKYISRDELMVELFGETSLSIYGGSWDYLYHVFGERVKSILEESEESLDLIVDCWNGSSSARKSLIKEFRGFGADRVIAWKFVTPKNLCLNWFMKKEDSKFYSERNFLSDYQLYYKTSKDIENDGFDKVYFIDGSQRRLF